MASGGKTLSPPWCGSANSYGGGTDEEEEEEEVMSVDDLMCSPRPAGRSGAMRVGGVGFHAAGVVSPGAPGAGVPGVSEGVSCFVGVFRGYPDRLGDGRDSARN